MEQRFYSFHFERAQYDFVVGVSPFLPMSGTVVVVTRKPYGLVKGVEGGIAFAICAREDEFDIRIGVPLALKRALRQIKGIKRPEIMREFFRKWPEAHPQYRTKKVEEPRESVEKLLVDAYKEMPTARLGRFIVSPPPGFTAVRKGDTMRVTQVQGGVVPEPPIEAPEHEFVNSHGVIVVHKIELSDCETAACRRRWLRANS